MLQICYNCNTNLYILKKFFKNFHIPYISQLCINTKVYKYKIKKKKKQIVMIYLYHNN